MVIVLTDILMNQITVRRKLDIRFDSVIKLFELFCNCALEFFWSVIGNKLCSRKKSQVVYKEFCKGEGILCVSCNCKLFIDDTVFEEEVGIAFNQVVKIFFVLSNY